MTIRIDSTDTIGVWHVEFNGGNWIAALQKQGEQHKLTYRFRYYEDDRAWDSEDRKSWYEAVTSEPKDKCLSAIRQAASLMAIREGARGVDEVLMTEAGLEDFLNRFMVQPWARTRNEGHA